MILDDSANGVCYPVESNQRDTDELENLLQDAVRRQLVADVLKRPKQGIGVPVDIWLRRPLLAWTEESLNNHRLQRDGIFDPEPICRKWNEHKAGIRHWHYPLWNVLMLRNWLNVHH